MKAIFLSDAHLKGLEEGGRIGLCDRIPYERRAGLDTAGERKQNAPYG